MTLKIEKKQKEREKTMTRILSRLIISAGVTAICFMMTKRKIRAGDIVIGSLFFTVVSSFICIY